MARSHKITWSQVLWIQARELFQQSFLITGFVFHWRITRQWRWSVCLSGPENNVNVNIYVNKIHDLPEAERAPFYLSVQIPEKCTYGNDGTAILPTIQMTICS